MVVPGELNGVGGAEIGAGGAEGAGAQVEGQGDLIALIVRQMLHRAGDGIAGADPLAHAAAQAAVRMVDDAAPVVGGGLAGDNGVHGAAALGEELVQRFFHKRKIHYFICPLFSFLWIGVAWVAGKLYRALSEKLRVIE